MRTAKYGCTLALLATLAGGCNKAPSAAEENTLNERTPGESVAQMIDAAREGDIEGFKRCFTNASVAIIDTTNDAAWTKMMSLLVPGKGESPSGAASELKGERAVITLNIDGRLRKLNLVKRDSKARAACDVWRVELVNPEFAPPSNSSGSAIPEDIRRKMEQKSIKPTTGTTQPWWEKADE